MAKELMGDVCAFCKLTPTSKAQYPKIGVAFRDGDQVSIKIDTLPLAGNGWTGWVNIFPRKGKTEDSPAFRQRLKEVDKAFDDFEDDIPF